VPELHIQLSLWSLFLDFLRLRRSDSGWGSLTLGSLEPDLSGIVVIPPNIAQNTAERDNLRHYQSYSHRGANFRIASTHPQVIRREIRRQRAVLESYIKRHPGFASSLEPLELPAGAPEVVRRMQEAAAVTGVGPMAAVAGTMAHLAVDAARAAGAGEAVVENGGDIFLYSTDLVTVALYAGDNPLSGKLALRVQPQRMPLAICSSSSIMGHSLSLGACDLATVVAPDGALADAAATLACNLVKSPGDVPGVLQRISTLPGVCGVLIIKADKVGVAGDLPELIRHNDPNFSNKITKDARSGALPAEHDQSRYRN
jgi:ApbE superfamily uncharacterized protein (UPF0280 family)